MIHFVHLQLQAKIGFSEKAADMTFDTSKGFQN